MAKYSPLSGFPEWTPGQKMLEQELMAKIAQEFELCGFAPIETRSVEPLSILTKKGDDKEIYTLNRLHSHDDQQNSAEAQVANDQSSQKEPLGLHFDLTVPFARYVIEHQHLLCFPFKRYQIQKVWRGERPQEGRYREFYQCDIDVVGAQTLDVSADAEMANVMIRALKTLPIPPILFRINNRKVLQGFYQGLGIDQLFETLRIVDKLAKIGPEAVAELLQKELSITDEAVAKILALAHLRGGLDIVRKAQTLGVEHPLLTEGLDELAQVLQLTRQHDNIEVDFSIARGLDYYTGTVYECTLIGHVQLGSICSGGRYDNLAEGGRVAYPGVGASIGLTRLLGYLYGRSLLTVETSTPVQVMILLNNADSREQSYKIADILRSKSIATDVYHTAQNFGKQLKGIQKRGIPYALFIEDDGYAVKTMASGEQKKIDINHWMPEPTMARVSYTSHF